MKLTLKENWQKTMKLWNYKKIAKEKLCSVRICVTLLINITESSNLIFFNNIFDAPQPDSPIFNKYFSTHVDVCLLQSQAQSQPAIKIPNIFVEFLRPYSCTFFSPQSRNVTNYRLRRAMQYAISSWWRWIWLKEKMAENYSCYHEDYNEILVVVLLRSVQIDYIQYTVKHPWLFWFIMQEKLYQCNRKQRL